MAPGSPAPGLTVDHPADVQGAVAEALLLWLWTTGAGVLLGGLLGAWVASSWLLTGLVAWAAIAATFAVVTRVPRSISTRIEIAEGQLFVHRTVGPLALAARQTPLRQVADVHVGATGSLVLTLRSGDRWIVWLPHLPKPEVARLAATILHVARLPDRSEPWKALDRQRSQLITLLDRDPGSGR